MALEQRRIRRRGIVTVIVAVVVTSIAGLWLAAQPGRAEMSLSELALGGIVAFVVVTPIYLFGTYWYVQGSRDIPDVGTSEMEIQRALIDLMRVRREISFAEAAAELEIDQATVREQIESLMALGIFTGRVDWDAGVIHAEDALMLSD